MASPVTPLGLRSAADVVVLDDVSQGEEKFPAGVAVPGMVKDTGEERRPDEQLRRFSGLFAGGSGGMGLARMSPEAIKEKVRAAKFEPCPYSVYDAYHRTTAGTPLGFFSRLAQNERFENTTLAIIVVNALWISHDTDGNTGEWIKAHWRFIIADILFLGYFSVELFVRFMAFRRKCDCLKDGWFKFDSALVALYWFDPFALTLIAAAQGGKGLDLPTAVLRLFRLARLSRLIRMLRSLPELMVMIKGIMQATTTVGYTLGLLILITYVFAIALRNLVPPDSEILVEYFSSVPEAMHNLIMYGTFLDALSDFIKAVKKESPACLILSWMYICLASLTVMNMLIGILCEVISAVAEEEKESMMVDKVSVRLNEVMKQIDKDNDGDVSWEEFQCIPDYPEAMKALESVGVDPEAMIDIAEEIFHDEKGEWTVVSFEDFMSMVLDLRGGQQATVKDIMQMGKINNKKFRGLTAKVDSVTSRMEGMEAKMDQILSLLNKTNNPQALG